MAEAKIPVDLILSKLAGDAEKAPERIQKAKDVLLSELDTAIATTPYEVVYQEDRVKLKHYVPIIPKNKLMKTPLLVVYALINRETMLDLQPGRSIVQNFLDDGIDLYMVDWGYPTRKDMFLTIGKFHFPPINGCQQTILSWRNEIDNINIQRFLFPNGNTFSNSLFSPISITATLFNKSSRPCHSMIFKFFNPLLM